MSGFAEIPEQPEQVPGRAIGWILVATVLSIVASAVIVWALDAFQLSGGGRSQPVSIEQVPPAQPFALPLPPETERAATRSQLDGWTWADAAHRTVRVPVDLAIDRYLDRYRGGAR